MATEQEMRGISSIAAQHRPPRIVLFGKTGQVGWELQRSLAPLGELFVLGTGSQSNPGQLCGDFLNPAGIAHTLATLAPKYIVNASAYTAVDKAEGDSDKAYAINAHAPALLARYATQNGAWLFHYSSDYVFDGSGSHARSEDAAVAPLSVYGKSKLEGEIAVAQCPHHLQFRTSWVYGAQGGNFAKTMIRLAQERDQLTVINDQIGAPTGADLIADITAHALRQVQLSETQSSSSDALALAGIYHLVAAGECSWYDYAKFVLHHAQSKGVALKVGYESVQPILTAQYPTPAQRPLNSRLDTQKIQKTFSVFLPHWQHGVTRMLTEIL
jgi:dTDP-4-dehydrorhamnose reductase